MQLRAAAFASPKSDPPSLRWPPDVADLFQDARTPPEITPADLSVDTLRSGVLRHGCLLVRGLIPMRRVNQLVQDIDRAFDAFDQQSTGGSQSDWFVPFDPGAGRDELVPRAWVRGSGGVLAVDSPPSFFDLLETFDEVGARELIGGYLAEPPVILAAKVTLRRMRLSELTKTVPIEDRDFHQDGAFMGAGIRSLNMWISLSHCGEDAPGLDLVPCRFDEIVDAGTGGAAFSWSVTAANAERASRDGVVSPVFAPGDALFFDHFLLHRTKLEPGMTKDRHAIEAWFAAASSYPSDQVPIVY